MISPAPLRGRDRLQPLRRPHAKPLEIRLGLHEFGPEAQRIRQPISDHRFHHDAERETVQLPTPFGRAIASPAHGRSARAEFGSLIRR
ncbi:hypothetical protein ACFYT3_13890 [Nocardia amikacinitolerans]|uniref:hypothetical protein n=1 Tax=Nocardia amikacinitolerans TaxID=756689 RepID=UPI00367E7449